MVDYFSEERTILLLQAGDLVHVQPKSDRMLDAIGEAMIENFSHVRQCTSDSGMMCCLWAIRQTEDRCLPFVFFDGCDDYRLWQNFMLFDRFRETSELSLPVLLIGSRDVFGDELGGKPNDVLGKKVVHLEEI